MKVTHSIRGGSKKRIFYCEGNIDSTTGGSYFSLFLLVDGLDKSRYEPTVVFHTENVLIPMYRDAGINVLVFEFPKPVHLTLGKNYLLAFLNKPLLIVQKPINFFRGFILQSLKYAWYMKENNIDLLHLNNSITRNHPWMFAAQIAKIRCITHERGINLRYNRIARYFAKRLDAVICVSEAVRNNMVEQGIGAENLVVIHNGVDPDRVKVGIPANEIRKEFEIEADAPIIGIGGNIRKWKGQEVVIRATSLIKKKFPNIRCFIIGDTGSEHARYKERLFNLVSELKLEGNIIFTGYRKNLADYFNAMDIVLHASVLPEPFGRVLIEAMALKKPLIGARGGAIPEIIEHEVTGLMCEPGNVEEYANAIERLLADNESAREMGRKAYERLQKEFHIKRNVEKTEQLYEQIFSRL